MRSDLVVDLPVTLDRTDDTALPQQLAQQIRALIGRGVLNPGDQLPSGRTLAGELSVARGTVVTAYEELCAEGYLVARHGSGTMVNPNLAHLHPQGTTTPLRTPVRHSHLVKLTPGAPDTSDLADPSWRAAWRQAAAHPGITNTDPLGLPELRWQICEHLRQMRSLVCDPGQVVVTSGAREGLALLLHVARGSQTIGVESPGYPSLRKVPPALGHHTVNLATDEHGLLTDELPEQGLDAVLVTPGHQYPDGGSLSTPRRVELAAWAARTHSWIIEDDFDGEYRHESAPLGPLRSTARGADCVITDTWVSMGDTDHDERIEALERRPAGAPVDGAVPAVRDGCAHAHPVRRDVGDAAGLHSVGRQSGRQVMMLGPQSRHAREHRSSTLVTAVGCRQYEGVDLLAVRPVGC